MIRNITLKKNGKLQLDSSTLSNSIEKVNDADIAVEENGEINVKVTGDDPYIVLNNMSELMQPVVGKPAIYNWIMIIASLILGFVAVNSLIGFKEAVSFLKLSVNNTSLIKSLSKNSRISSSSFSVKTSP